jgi:hypothetical protein
VLAVLVVVALIQILQKGLTAVTHLLIYIHQLVAVLAVHTPLQQVVVVAVVVAAVRMVLLLVQELLIRVLLVVVVARVVVVVAELPQ